LQEYIQRKNAVKPSDKYFSLLFLFCRRIKLVLYIQVYDFPWKLESLNGVNINREAICVINVLNKIY